MYSIVSIKPFTPRSTAARRTIIYIFLLYYTTNARDCTTLLTFTEDIALNTNKYLGFVVPVPVALPLGPHIAAEPPV